MKRLLIGFALAVAASNAHAAFENLDFCPASAAGSGTVQSVREVLVVRDLHGFDPGVLEHRVAPKTAEEFVGRLDGGSVLIFAQDERLRMRAGQRVRVILTGTAVLVEPELQYCPA